MKYCIWFVICIVASIAGVQCVGLYKYIMALDGTGACDRCDNNSNCFAKRKLFKNSSVLDEFMLAAYIGSENRCRYAEAIAVYQSFMYCIISIILASVLFWSKGCGLVGILYGVSATMMLALSVVDWNTQYIPVEYTVIIAVCGLIRMFADISNWWNYVIGLIAVSGFLYVVDKLGTVIMSKRYPEAEIDGVMGDGDIKLMAATGLLIGWKLNFIALGIGCIAGSVIHIILMKIKGSESKLALGPYLSLGVYITMICGEQLVSWYLNTIGINPYQ